MKNEYDTAVETAENNSKGCFGSWFNGIFTILTLGTYCIHLNNVMKESKKALDEVTRTKDSFTNNVAPLVGELEGMNGVAESLLAEAMDKRTVIKAFEEEVKHKATIFKSAQGNEIFLLID